MSHCESPASLCTSFATSRGSLKEELIQAMEEAYWGDENMALLRGLRSCLKGSHRKQGKNKKSLVIRIIDVSDRNMMNIQNIFEKRKYICFTILKNKFEILFEKLWKYNLEMTRISLFHLTVDYKYEQSICLDFPKRTTFQNHQMPQGLSEILTRK